MSDSSASVEFEFDGQKIVALPGQTIAGALHAAGQHVLSRSFKYHRPRGLLCVSGRCPNCLCTVDGTPNERVCTRPVEPGMVVKSQNRWPSLGFDFLSIFNKFDRFMPVGFYYKSMFRPRWMWPWWEKVIRRIAGLGSIDRAHGADGVYDKVNEFTDVAVVGAGWAGLNAALAAADAGARVVLVDEQTELGGHLRHDPDLRPANLDELIRKVTGHPHIRTLTSAVCFGAYDDRYLGIRQQNRMYRVRAAQIVIATGGWERPLVFENNDLPGVLLASGAQRLLHLDHCRFEGQVVVLTDGAQGYRVARQLQAAGSSIAAVVDVRESPNDAFTGAPVLAGQTILAATGGTHVTSAKVGTLSGEFKTTVPCRWIVQAVGFTAASSLLYQAGCSLKYEPSLDQASIQKFALGYRSAGCVNGYHDLAEVGLQGIAAGTAAARDALSKSPGTTVPPESTAPSNEPTPCAHYVVPSGAKKKFVCLCEDVTEKDVCDAVAEGYSNIETLKRYSTVSMGPCQGKMCQSTSIAICARQNNLSIADTGVTTSRPPEQPVPLGVLAGRALHFTLVRRSAMHGWHEQAGAAMADAGNWKRPAVYTSIDDEYQAVRTRAGLVDVSTLGKLELRGTDVPKFLEFVYPNRFENLAVGRVRYGVLCGEDGIILDDGTVSRLESDRYFITTTTGNADAIDSWFRNWLTSRPDWDIRLANVGTSYSAMNLAGPRSREILKKLTDADVSAEALPYLSAVQIQIAGVSAIVLRIGFVGELGYEIHVPSQFGLHVWEAIMAAGQPLGIKPFGIEAQRLLRLEKQHFLPGVDTDALSNPLEAGLDWIVKLDKPDFIGRYALSKVAKRPLKQRLIGFQVPGSITIIPGAVTFREGKVAGRVTSSAYSPAVGATIGLAWVGADQARDGTKFDIRVGEQNLQATVQEQPFYDPAGAKLKS